MDAAPKHDDAAPQTRAKELALFLESHKAEDVVILDFRALSMWTDFFVIGTVSSGAHLAGLKRRIREFLRQSDGEAPAGKRAASAESSGWELIDLGSVVVHLMTREARDFYELERLWSAAAPVKEGA